MSCDQGFRNRSVFENINIEVHPRGFFDQFVEGRHGILRFVFGSIEFLDIGLEGGPVRCNVTKQKFNSFLDFKGAVVWEAGAALCFSKSEVLAFNTPFFEELSDIVAVELHSTRLAWTGHGRSIHAHGRWCVKSGTAGGIGSNGSHGSRRYI